MEPKTKKATITIQKELKRLAQVVINIVEANGFGVISTYTRSYVNRILNCGSFNLEIYIYPYLNCLPHIWITRNSSEIDSFDSLIKQLQLAGFDVDIVIEQMSKLK